MNSPGYRVRRATLDDIGPLTALWKSMGYASDDLARRVTEFQIAEGPEGKLLGGAAIEIQERQGLIHSEAFADFALADPLRELLWDRLQSVATNQGLLRIWTREQAPFWRHCGMNLADAEALRALPGAWRGNLEGWLTVKLREDPSAIISADKEFAIFMAAEKQRTDRALRHARLLKAAATLLAVVLFMLVLAGAVYVLRRNRHLMPH